MRRWYQLETVDEKRARHVREYKADSVEQARRYHAAEYPLEWVSGIKVEENGDKENSQL